MATDSQKLDRVLELVERNSADIDALSKTVTKLAATVETGFAAVSEDVERLERKIEDNHQDMLSRFSGLERRLDSEAIERQDLQLPRRVAAIETHLGIARSIPA